MRAHHVMAQSYLHYWDKLERANYFLETMWSTSSEALDGRLMQWLLKAPVMVRAPTTPQRITCVTLRIMCVLVVTSSLWD